MRSRLFRENRATYCQEIEEFRRICCEETDRAGQARIDELSLHQERNSTTVGQLLAQIQDVQNKVNSLSDAREFYDPETASSSGATDVPSQPSTIPSPKTMLCFGSGFSARYTEYYGYCRKRFWTTTCSRRTHLYSLQQFQEFGILFSRIETWYWMKYNEAGE